MHRSISIIIPGQPTSWARAGHSRGKFYDSQLQIKNQLRLLISRQYDGPPLTGPLSVSMRFMFKRPQYRKKQTSTSDYHFTRPDIDNACKFCLDLFQPQLFTDDCICARLLAEKMYTDDEPYSEIIIEQL